MRVYTKCIFVLIIAGILLFALPAVIILILSLPIVSNYINNVLDLTNGEFIEYIVNYISLSISLFLGIVVYFQSQKINDLEATQFNTYIGVEDVDYSFTFGDYLVMNKNQKGLCISHIFKTDKKAILTSISIGEENPSKSIVIPLVFITKNQPLIVSLDFQGVRIKFNTCKKGNINKYFKSDNGKIYSTLGDGSRFVLGFGMTLSNSYKFDEIDLEFTIAVEDQNGNKQILRPIITLNKGENRSEYHLTSTRTIT